MQWDAAFMRQREDTFYTLFVCISFSFSVLPLRAVYSQLR